MAVGWAQEGSSIPHAIPNHAIPGIPVVIGLCHWVLSLLLFAGICWVYLGRQNVLICFARAGCNLYIHCKKRQPWNTRIPLSFSCSSALDVRVFKKRDEQRAKSKDVCKRTLMVWSWLHHWVIVILTRLDRLFVSPDTLLYTNIYWNVCFFEVLSVTPIIYCIKH